MVFLFLEATRLGGGTFAPSILPYVARGNNSRTWGCETLSTHDPLLRFRRTGQFSPLHAGTVKFHARPLPSGVVLGRQPPGWGGERRPAVQPRGPAGRAVQSGTDRAEAEVPEQPRRDLGRGLSVRASQSPRP